MALQWVSANLRTGGNVVDLPTFVPAWPLRRTIGGYDTGSGTLFLDGAPPSWENAIVPGGAVLACYDDEDDTRAIQWAGYVVDQDRNTGTESVTVNLATVEGYLDRRFVGDSRFAQVGQNTIAEALIAWAMDNAIGPGLPFELICEDGDGVPGTLRDRRYFNSDNSTVFARLGQLAGVIGGLEWTIDWRWSDDRTSLVPQFRYGSRIGAAALAGLDPAVSFDYPGPVLQSQLAWSYADGQGGNVVTAYSSGQGDATPTSGPVAAPDFDVRPVFEFRYQPGSSITRISFLADYAARALAQLAPGSATVTLTAQLTSLTRPGGQWRLGDDVGHHIEPNRTFPRGYSVTGRAIAYELDGAAGTITPVLAVAALPTYTEDEAI